MLYFKKNIRKKYTDNSVSTNIQYDDDQYIVKKTNKFHKVLFSLFCAGLSTFSILYCVQPILPIFSIEFHLTPYESSLSLSSSTATMALGMLFTGSLSDSIGRKIIMSSSLFLATLFTILCALMDTWNEIIIMRMLTGFALSGVAAVAMTYLSEEIHPKFLPFAIGLYISGNTLGGFSGRLLSSILINYCTWKMSLFIIGIISLTASIIFLKLLPESKNFCGISFSPKKILYNLILQCSDKILFSLFIVGFVLMGSFVTLFNYVGYRLMIKPFFLNQIVIGFLSIVYLTGIYSSLKASILIKRFGRRNVLIYSLMTMILGLLITQLNILIVIIFGLMLFSSGFFASHSIASSWIGYRAKVARGQASSLYLCCYYLGSSILGTLSGVFWSFGHWIGISIFVIVILLIAIKIVYRINIKDE